MQICIESVEEINLFAMDRNIHKILRELKLRRLRQSHVVRKGFRMPAVNANGALQAAQLGAGFVAPANQGNVAVS